MYNISRVIQTLDCFKTAYFLAQYTALSLIFNIASCSNHNAEGLEIEVLEIFLEIKLVKFFLGQFLDTSRCSRYKSMLVFGCDELNVLQIGRFSGFLIFHSQAKAEANLKRQIIY